MPAEEDRINLKGGMYAIRLKVLRRLEARGLEEKG